MVRLTIPATAATTAAALLLRPATVAMLQAMAGAAAVRTAAMVAVDVRPAVVAVGIRPAVVAVDVRPAVVAVGIRAAVAVGIPAVVVIRLVDIARLGEKGLDDSVELLQMK